MKIKVTKSDILNGSPGYCESCPVALAIGSRIGNKISTIIRVGCSLITINGTKYRVPKVVKRFINNFDDGNKVKPFEFDLRKR